MADVRMINKHAYWHLHLKNPHLHKRQVFMAVSAFGDLIRMALFDGMQVHIPGLGIIRPPVTPSRSDMMRDCGHHVHVRPEKFGRRWIVVPAGKAEEFYERNAGKVDVQDAVSRILKHIRRRQ